MTIDRACLCVAARRQAIFLRICEDLSACNAQADRGIEDYLPAGRHGGTLQNLIGKPGVRRRESLRESETLTGASGAAPDSGHLMPGVYRRLMERFEDADKRYNSGLFDFRKDTVTPSLKIDDKLLSDILSELYPPKSPYEFSVIGIEILGEVYEQFQGIAGR